MGTFSHISHGELPIMYEGMSINEIAKTVDESYTRVMNNLVASQTGLRTGEEGMRRYPKNHPEWPRQLVKYSIEGTDSMGEQERFIELFGFSSGVSVTRKKAGLWYGGEKIRPSRLCLDTYSGKKVAKTSGRRGCFEQCKGRSDTMPYLIRGYDESSGGERTDW